jgi:cyclopropane fatty-acyl-phospholipid synthase-like methyltransferase
MHPVQTEQLISFLRNSDRLSLKTLDRVKQVYRPMICPFDTLLNLLPENEQIAEIGCGIGTFLFLLNEYRRPVSLAGLEVDSGSIETAKKVLAQISSHTSLCLQTYDGITIPQWIGEYKYVLLIDMLHHMPLGKHTAFLARLYHQMRPGSQLIIKDIDAGRRFLYLFNKAHDFILTGGRTYERKLSQLQDTLQCLGFTVKQIITQRLYVYPHFTIVCQR